MHKFKGLNGHSKKDKVTYWHGSWRWMCWSFLLPTDLWPSSLSLRFIRSGSFLVSYELAVSECVCFKLLRNCTLTRWLSWISLIDHVTPACLIGCHQVSSSVEHSHYLFTLSISSPRASSSFVVDVFADPGQPMIGPMRRRLPACPKPMPSLVHHRVHFCASSSSIRTLSFYWMRHTVVFSWRLMRWNQSATSMSSIWCLPFYKINSRIVSDIFLKICLLTFKA